MQISLFEIALLLAAAAIAAPIAKWLKVGTVLGYLLAGVLLGPFGFGKVFSVYEAKEILHTAEFGVILLLFLIGLELRPKRLWSMRASILGLGGAQVAGTAALLCPLAMMLGQPLMAALFIGLALSYRQPRSHCRYWRKRASSPRAMAGRRSRCCCSRIWRRSR